LTAGISQGGQCLDLLMLFGLWGDEFFGRDLFLSSINSASDESWQ